MLINLHLNIHSRDIFNFPRHLLEMSLRRNIIHIILTAKMTINGQIPATYTYMHTHTHTRARIRRNEQCGPKRRADWRGIGLTRAKLTRTYVFGHKALLKV